MDVLKLELSDVILAAVKMAGDRVLGRTAIQKLVYFLTIYNLVDARYRPHYYGPYSVDVANSIQMLSSIDFITEEIETPETILRDKIITLKKDTNTKDQTGA